MRRAKAAAAQRKRLQTEDGQKGAELERKRVYKETLQKQEKYREQDIVPLSQTHGEARGKVWLKVANGDFHNMAIAAKERLISRRWIEKKKEEIFEPVHYIGPAPRQSEIVNRFACVRIKRERQINSTMSEYEELEGRSKRRKKD